MGRKPKSKASAAVTELPEEAASTVETKQQAGNDALAAKKYGEALNAYDEALKALPERHALVAELHAKKASVYLADKKWKEAVKECNQGLAVEGSNAKVLRCRADARYQLEMYKDALSDIQKVNATGDRSEELQEFESRVRNALSGKNSKSGGGSANGSSTAVAEAPANTVQKKAPVSKDVTANILRQNGSNFACKVTLDAETKYVHVPFGVNYHQLQQLIKSKWTGLHNFKIYYHDKDSDWILMTCAKDVQKAQQEILAYAQRVINQRQRQGLDAQPPTCRFKLEKCFRGDVPQPPKDELPRGDETSRVVVKSVDPHAEETVVELDEWLIDFANLFRDQLGVDPDKHVDMHTEGADKCSRALDTVVHLSEAQKLFDEAQERFRDVTCIGLCNWANVHLCRAKKLVEKAAVSDDGFAGIKEEFEKQCDASMQRYNEALGYNDQYVEAMLGIGQIYIERARAAAGVLVPALDDVDSELYKQMDSEELEEVTKMQGKDSNRKLRAALKSVQSADVKKSGDIWSQVYEYFAKAEKAAEGQKEARTQEREDSRADVVVSPPFNDQTHLIENQVQIIWGNALYDQSQIWAGVGLDGWKQMVDDAKKRFISATCKESDVIDALRNHIGAEGLDLPPEEKADEKDKVPEKVPEKKPASAEKSEGGAKGLPALKKKKKADK